MAKHNEIRINKFLARAGISSRRGADALVEAGQVKVNGKVVSEAGLLVDPDSDEVMVRGKIVGEFQDKVTIVLNKPADVMTTMADPQGRETVADLIKNEPFRMVPVGRLDYPTEGVLLMTTDGELANRLLHPRFKVPKSYYVKVGGIPSPTALNRLRDGIQLEDGKTKPALVEVLENLPRRSWLEIILTEGKKRQVRRMCEAIGHRPLRVVRTSFSHIDCDKLRPGQYRYLTSAELVSLYRMVGMSRSIPKQPEYVMTAEGRKLGVARRRKGALPGEQRTYNAKSAPKKKSTKKKRSYDREDNSKYRPRAKAHQDGKAVNPRAGLKKKRVQKKVVSRGIKPSDYKKRQTDKG